VTARTVVIGAGVIGSSIAWHLTAEPGADVLLLDAQPRPSGATGIRSAYPRTGGRPASGRRVRGPVGGRHQVGVSADRWAANGIGAAPLLATAGLELPITLRRIGLAQVPPPEPRTGDRGLPSCIDDVTGTYFAPRDNGLLAVGVRARTECDPRLQAPPLSAEEIDEARARAVRQLPGRAASPPRTC
jgi:glycine/D-amino acid oxidase-like deaminating enzyme